MASPFVSNVSMSSAPTDYAMEARDIDRRRKYAEMLQQQAMTVEPQQMAGGYVVPTSWTQGLAKALQAGVGAYQSRDADSREKALVARQQAAQTADTQTLAGALQGTPQQPPMTPNDDDGNPNPPVAATPATGITPEVMGRMQTPEYRQMLAQMMMTQAAKAQDPYTLAPGAQRVGPGGAVIAKAPFKPEGPASIGSGGLRMPDGTVIPPEAKPNTTGTWGDPYDLNGVTVQKNDLTGQIRTAAARPPQVHISNPAPVTPVTIADPNDPTGMNTVVIDGRTQQVLGKGPKLTQTGAVDQKLATQMPQAKSRVAAISQNMDRLDAAMEELNNDPGLSHITGTLAGRTPNLTNVATGAQAKLNSVKSQVFQSSLQAMREASKTGGAVGNVSDREGDKLERTLAALDQAQGTKDFKAQLAKAQQQVRLSKQIIQQAYEEQFGGVQSSPTGAPRSGGASGNWSVVR